MAFARSQSSNPAVAASCPEKPTCRVRVMHAYECVGNGALPIIVASMAPSDNSAEFVRLEIQSGLVMVQLAHAERGLDSKGVKQAMNNARKALETAGRFLRRLKHTSPEVLDELTQGVEKLQSVID